MTDNDQLEQLRLMMERSLEGQKMLEAKFDTHRAESAKRTLDAEARERRVEDKIDATRRVVGELATRVATAESDIRGLRDTDAATVRQAGEVDLAHEAALGGAIAHVRTVDSALTEVKDEVAEVKGDVVQVKGEVDKAARVDQAVCAELGLDYDQVANDAMGPSKPKKSTLTKLARENKAGTLASAITLITLVLQIALQLLGKH